MKLVLDGGRGGVRGTLVVGDLAAAFGRMSSSAVRGWADPNGAHRCLVIDDPAALPLARDAATGGVVMAARGLPGSRQLLATLPFVPRELLTAMLDEAGVVRYVDSPDVIVRADSSLVVLHTNRAGSYQLRLPRAAVLRDAVTGRELGHGSQLSLALPAPSTTLIELE